MNNLASNKQIQTKLIILILLAAFATLPWLGMGDFYSKGEPREAGLAVYMLNEMSWEAWVIPQSYADEFAYKPPLTHWLMATFSLIFNEGEVSTYTSRLPSALAFIIMIGCSFVFFAKRRSVKEAFIGGLIVITCFEIHRAAVSCRIDMLLSCLMTCALIQLYCWYESRKKKQLICVWILLSLGTLTKGPVGAVVPVFIFFVFLLVIRENFWKTIKLCSIVFLPSLILPAVWYYLAYQVEGAPFLIKAFGENIGRFLSLKAEDMGSDYELGVENPWYYYPISILAGLVPWSLLLVFAISLIPFSKLKSVKWSMFAKTIVSWDKLILFSFIVIVVSILFFSIPSSKRSVYILYLYPFFGFFIAILFCRLAEKRSRIVNINTGILAFIAIVAVVVIVLVNIGVLSLDGFSKRERTLHDIQIFSNLFQHITMWGYIMIPLLAVLAGYAIYAIFKSKGYLILSLGFALSYTINLMQDSFLLPAFKNSYSSRAIASKLSSDYDLEGNTYVMNNLLEKYYNMYGLNFYLGNCFKNFEKERPEHGYLLAGKGYIDRVKEKYGEQYDFVLLEQSKDRFNDFHDQVLFYRIDRKGGVQN